MVEFIAMFFLYHKKGFRENSYFPATTRFGQRRHANDATAVYFNIAPQIGKGAPKAYVVIHQKIISPLNNCSGKHSRCGEPMPTISPRVGNITQLAEIIGGHL